VDAEREDMESLGYGKGKVLGSGCVDRVERGCGRRKRAVIASRKGYGGQKGR